MQLHNECLMWGCRIESRKHADTLLILLQTAAQLHAYFLASLNYIDGHGPNPHGDVGVVVVVVIVGLDRSGEHIGSFDAVGG